MSYCRRFILLFALPLILVAQSPPQCQVELFIGDPEFSAGDGGPALDAKFASLGSMTAADDGTIFVADYLNYRIRKIDPQGIITTIAGDGTRGTAGDGGLAVHAQLSNPSHLNLAPDGALYFVDDDFKRIRKIAANGAIETVYSLPAGSIGGIFAGQGGVVYFTETARLPSPLSGNVLGLYRLESNGTKTTIAGGTPGGGFGQPQDGVPALEFKFAYAGAVAVDSSGDVLVGDLRRIMRIGDDGIIRAVVGNGGSTFVDGAPPLETGLGTAPSLLTVSDAGDLFLGGSHNSVYVVRNGVIQRLVSGRIEGLTSSAAGVFFSRDTRVFRLFEDASTAAIAGVDRDAWYEPGRPLNQSMVGVPRKMLTDSQDRLYYFDTFFPGIVFRTTLDGKIEVVAGGGDQPADDGVSALNAAISSVGDIALDGQDRLYISVGLSPGRPSMILRVEANGTLTVLAGEGDITQPEFFNNQQAADANFLGRIPFIAVSPGGTLYFQVRSRSFQVDAEGIMRDALPGPTSFMAFDRQGQLLSIESGLEVYTDALGPSFQPFSSSVTQGASTNNGAYFGLASNLRVLRSTPQGRTTDLLAASAGIQFENGKLSVNGGLGPINAIATNGDGDLFIAASSLGRVFVIRGSETCSMERPYSAAILNGASFTSPTGVNGFAPGELVSVFGDFLGGDALAYGAPGQSSQGTWQTNVGGLEVFVDDQPAPVIFSRADQSAFVIPNEVSGELKLRFRRNGLDSPTFSYQVKNAAPGVFTVNSSGGGQAAALNQDSSINSPSNRAAPGSVIVLSSPARD